MITFDCGTQKDAHSCFLQTYYATKYSLINCLCLLGAWHYERIKQVLIKHIIHLVHHHKLSLKINRKQILDGIAVYRVTINENFVVELKLLSQHVIRKPKPKLLLQLRIWLHEAKVVPNKIDNKSLSRFLLGLAQHIFFWGKHDWSSHQFVGIFLYDPSAHAIKRSAASSTNGLQAS